MNAHEPSGDALASSSASVSTSEPRAVFTQPRAVVHAGQAFGVHEVPGRRQVRRVHGDDVGPREEVVERPCASTPSARAPSSSRYGIGDRDARRRATAAARSRAGRSSTRRSRRRAARGCRRSPVGPTPSTGSRPARVAVAVADAEHVLGDHHDGGEGELGDRHRVGRGRARHDDAVFPRRGRDRHLHRSRRRRRAAATSACAPAARRRARCIPNRPRRSRCSPSTSRVERVEVDRGRRRRDRPATSSSLARVRREQLRFDAGDHRQSAFGERAVPPSRGLRPGTAHRPGRGWRRAPVRFPMRLAPRHHRALAAAPPSRHRCTSSTWKRRPSPSHGASMRCSPAGVAHDEMVRAVHEGGEVDRRLRCPRCARCTSAACGSPPCTTPSRPSAWWSTAADVLVDASGADVALRGDRVHRRRARAGRGCTV